jgi:phage terminase large subunit-like protein
VLLPALKDRGIKPELFTNQDMGRACGHLQKLVADKAVAHSGDQLFAMALAVAVKRDIGDDLWTWSRRKSGDISPLVAVTGAAWLLECSRNFLAIY